MTGWSWHVDFRHSIRRFDSTSVVTMPILGLGSHPQCAGEATIGYSPISYFVLGCVEVVICSLLATVIIKRNFLPSVHQATRMNFLLPVYLTVVIFLVALGILMGVDRIVGMYSTNVFLTVGRWFVLRACTEGLSLFFRHAGIGVSSASESILLGTIWSMIDSLFLLSILLLAGFDTFVYLCLVVAFLLTVYYCVMWLAPYDMVHRRPAASSFALLNVIIILSQMAGIMAYLGSNQQGSANCAVELLFSITEFVQLGVMLYAFLLDSMFWQGLYTDERTNLNLPMMGMWDMNDRNTVKMVTESIAHLERKVVYIIPFSQLRVDTSKFFSGGSARVYRGKYHDMEVAIKFLFCMELTPGRVVEFCNEATLLNSLQHENIVHCHGVAIMPPAISLVTEFCTYGSLFDFLHSMDWMVTDERLSASVQSWTTGGERDRDSQSHVGAVGSSHQNSIGSAAQGSIASSGGAVSVPGTMGLTSSTPASASPLIMHPSLSSSNIAGEGTTNYPKFTKLTTPPPSPAPSPSPSPAVVANHKRVSVGPGVVQLQSRPVNTYGNPLRSATSDSDLEKGESELISRDSGSGKMRANRTDSSCTDVADRLADAVNSQFLAENAIKTASGSDRGSFTRSNSYRTAPSDPGRTGRVVSASRNPVRPGEQLQSATSILLTRELNYGMGPSRASRGKAKQNYSFNYTMKSVSGAHGSISAMGSRSIPSVLLSCISSSVHSLGHLLPTSIKLRMAKECCAGVSYLHSKNIMHCDIKSLNFLVTGSLNVKLADLGEARFFTDTDPRKLPKNINWSSPEILLDLPTAQITASADIWSLAMVIAEICNGEVPYDTQDCRLMTLDAFIDHLRAGNRPVLTKEFHSYPWLNEMLERAWSWDARQRCTSEEMLQIFIQHIG